jgi:hypothetical protein
MRQKRMSGIYRNGCDQELRPPCQSGGEWEPLRRDALRMTGEGKPALILGTLPASLQVAALTLDGTALRFQTVREMDLRHPMTVFPFNQQKVLAFFLDLALEKAFVFRAKPESPAGKPSAPGFHQEEGHHLPLWIGKELLVCNRCGGYVCPCGGCRCYGAGNKRAGLPLPREERVEYLRAILFCSANLETRSKAKIFLFRRKKKSKLF